MQVVGDTNGGTGASLPRTVHRAARGLGIPVYLVNATGPILCRRDGRGERVNIEGLARRVPQDVDTN